VEHLVLVGGISYFQPGTNEAYGQRADLVEKEGMDVLVDDWLAGAVSPQSHATLSGGVGLLRELFLRNDPQPTPSRAARWPKAPKPSGATNWACRP
jgi:3-oxoadipate enol-lactonase